MSPTPSRTPARVDALEVPWFHGFDVVTERFGGSGSSFTHRIFVRTGKKFVDVTPQGGIVHTNMGGLFFGLLGKGRGKGFVVWEANGDGENHYAPQTYTATFYEWNGSAFQKAGETNDPKKYEIPFPVPAPDFIGLPKGIYFDQSMPFVAGHYINRNGRP